MLSTVTSYLPVRFVPAMAALPVAAAAATVAAAAAAVASLALPYSHNLCARIVEQRAAWMGSSDGRANERSTSSCRPSDRATNRPTDQPIGPSATRAGR